MIKNQWYIVLETREVKNTPIGVTRMGEKMVFWRDETGKVHCAVDRCPHRGVQLSLGKIQDHHLQCPFHGFEYDGSGRCVHVPANGRGGRIPASLQLNDYPTHEEGDFIWIWWGPKPPEDLKPPRFFDNLTPDFSYGSKPDPWQTHYSRAIENQLDVVHLPFVHHNTIGRGNRTVVDGPLVRWDEEMMLCTYVFNRVDDGTPPRKPAQIDISEARSVHLEFIFPNLWQNYISDDTRVVIGFAPVDDENTVLYLRFYQSFLTLPLLGKLIAQLSMPANVLIAHQDRRVVVTQQPRLSAYQMNEKLIQGDLPIIEYRKKRAELKQRVGAGLEGSLK